MFAAKLINLRRSANMSQQQVAAKLAMARATYANLESGKRSPTLKQIKAIAQLFEISPASLIDSSQPSKGLIKPETIELNQPTNDIKPREVIKERVEALREVLLYVSDKVG